MPDYRKLFDSNFVRAYDLDGKSMVVVIVKVEAGEVGDPRRPSDKKKKMPFCYFKGATRPLGLNKTNAKTIAALYGNDTSKWIGKRIELFPTTTSFGNETVECVRVRPTIPKGAAVDMPTPPPPPNVDATGLMTVAATAPVADPESFVVSRCETGTCGKCLDCIAAQARELS